jgi:hypothetical protein
MSNTYSICRAVLIAVFPPLINELCVPQGKHCDARDTRGCDTKKKERPEDVRAAGPGSAATGIGSSPVQGLRLPGVGVL